MSNDPYYMVPDELKNLLSQVASEDRDETVMQMESPQTKTVNEMPSYILESQKIKK